MPDLSGRRSARVAGVALLLISSTAGGQERTGNPTDAPCAITGHRCDPLMPTLTTHARVDAPRAVRAATPPVVDGLPDDAVWNTSTPITDFRLYDPVENGTPSVHTEARIAYDATNLYVFVRAFDPEPQRIVGLLSRRDVRTPSDQIKLLIDSYHDRRTGFEFAVNPAGVKRDYATYDDAREDVSWDAVWDVATRVDSAGWTAEFRIPLSQLRYPAASENVFGIMITRDVARTNEHVSWPLLRRSRPGIASQFAEVAGFSGLAAPRRIEASPHLIARNRGIVRGEGIGRQQESQVGSDFKLGLGSSMTLDATVNPDFGQVEEDPAQLNLTAFETFLSERRPFFLEGAGTFGFGPDLTRLFYSRRIGRAPQLTGFVTDPSVDVPGVTPIAAAAKLSGRLGTQTSLGVLSALTERVTAGGQTVEPASGYAVIRAMRDFRGGESGLGVIATAMDRRLDSASQTVLRHSAAVAGLDGRHRILGGAVTLAGSVAASRVDGTASAIARTQRASTHSYQRADGDLVYDSTRTNLTGTAVTGSVDGTHKIVSAGVAYQRLTPGFESNDLGFLPRADWQSTSAYIGLQSARPASFWRNASTTLLASEERTAAGLPIARVLELDASVELPNAARVSANLWSDNVGVVYCDRCARGGPALRVSPDLNLLMSVQRDPRRRVVPQLAAIYTVGDGGRSTLWRVRPYVVVRPRSNLSWELGTRYQRNRDHTQWYANFGTVGADSTHYVFAHLDQQLLSFTARLDYTVTPALSFQAYAEPFVTTGSYESARELAAPRASRYADRFRPYAAGDLEGFNDKQFHSSAVMRWEYRPGSTLFFVWTQGRAQDDEDLGSFAATRDYRNLFAARPDNTLLIKASYWLGR